jgi:tetratricopeptide (TPR) repeat protein
LDQIDASFEKQSTVVLHGITGSGKTRLAESYAREQAETKQIYWISAGAEGIASAYVRLALKLNLVLEDDLKHPQGEEVAIEAVKKYFAEHPNCLLVLDDVTSDEALVYATASGEISLIPEGDAHVLVTRVLITSQSDLFASASLVEVEKLRIEEAIELLKRTTQKEVSARLLEQLVELLFYHPLLIDMTGSYIRQMSLRRRGESVEKIIEGEVKKLRESSTHLPLGRKEAIQQEVTRRWEINCARAREENAHIDQTLGICAYLAPKEIPLEWFTEELLKSFGILEAFGFCHRSAGEKSISMHALIQLLSRQKDVDYKALKSAATLVEAKWGYDEEEFNLPLEIKQHAVHVSQVVQHLVEAKIHTDQTVKLLMLLGRFYLVEVQLRESWNSYKEAHAILKALCGDAPLLNLAVVLNSMGAVASKLGELVEAKANFKEARAMMHGLYGKSPHPVLALVIMNLGNMAFDRGDFPKAKALLEEAHKMMGRLYGKSPNPHLAKVVMNLGAVAVQQRKFEEAKALLEEAHKMMGRLYGESPHPTLIQIIMNLGAVAIEQKEFTEAKMHFENVHKMISDHQGKSPHPMLAQIILNLGNIAFDQGDWTEAMAQFKKAHEMRCGLPGKDSHLDLAGLLVNLGAVAAQQREFTEAKDCNKKAQEMIHDLFGDGPHPLLAQIFINLGGMALQQKKLEEAEAYYKKAEKMTRDLYGDGPHPNLAAAKFNLRWVAFFKSAAQRGQDLLGTHDNA